MHNETQLDFEQFVSANQSLANFDAKAEIQKELEENMKRNLKQPKNLIYSAPSPLPPNAVKRPVIFPPQKIEILTDPTGTEHQVIAKEDIMQDEIVETCRLLKMGWRSDYHHDPSIRQNTISARGGEGGKDLYIPLGYGALYRKSKTGNLEMFVSAEKEIIQLKAKQAILKGQEIIIIV